MLIKNITRLIAAAAGAAVLSTNVALAQDGDAPARDLNQLLDFVKQGQVTEARENRAREQRFTQNKANQQAELRSAEAERARQEQLSAQLENTFEENELVITAKQAQLVERLGALSELFGHLTAASGDLASNIEVSLASAQYPDREVFLKDLIEKMRGSDTLTSVDEIERVW